MSLNGSTITDRFLEVEQETSELLSVLQALRTETEHYSRASRTVDEAAQHVQSLAEPLTAAAAGLDSVVHVLQEIGTPEILRRQEALQEDVARIVDLLSRTQEAVSSSVAQLRQELQPIR